MTCKKCGTRLVSGLAIQPTYTGVPDFPGDTHATTISPGGPGHLVNVLKCPACGWSKTATPEQLVGRSTKSLLTSMNAEITVEIKFTPDTVVRLTMEEARALKAKLERLLGEEKRSTFVDYPPGVRHFDAQVESRDVARPVSPLAEIFSREEPLPPFPQLTVKASA